MTTPLTPAEIERIKALCDTSSWTNSIPKIVTLLNQFADKEIPTLLTHIEYLERYCKIVESRIEAEFPIFDGLFELLKAEAANADE